MQCKSDAHLQDITNGPEDCLSEACKNFSCILGTTGLHKKIIYIFNKNSPISTRLSMITKLPSTLNNNSLHSVPEAELQNLSLSAWLPFQMPDRLDQINYI